MVSASLADRRKLPLSISPAGGSAVTHPRPLGDAVSWASPEGPSVPCHSSLLSSWSREPSPCIYRAGSHLCIDPSPRLPGC